MYASYEQQKSLDKYKYIYALLFSDLTVMTPTGFPCQNNLVRILHLKVILITLFIIKEQETILIETIIFDMDGVLVDSEPFWRKAKVNAVARFGGQITEQLAYQSTGLRIDEIANYWIRYCNLDPKCAPDLADAILTEVIGQIKTHGQLLPGVKESLGILAKTGLKIGLASSSPLRLIEAVLETFEIGKYFSVYVSAEHLPYGKPHPQVYMDAAVKLNTEPHNCLAIEDSVNGLIAAKAAGMTAICVPEPGQEMNPRFGIADIKLTSLEDFSNSKEVVKLLGKSIV